MPTGRARALLGVVVVLGSCGGDGDIPFTDLTTPTADVTVDVTEPTIPATAATTANQEATTPSTAPATTDDGGFSFDPSAEDFAAETIDFIEDDTAVSDATGLTYTNTTCETPASVDTDVTYTCRAEGSDGVTYEFTAEITSDDSFEIVDIVALD